VVEWRYGSSSNCFPIATPETWVAQKTDTMRRLHCSLLVALVLSLLGAASNGLADETADISFRAYQTLQGTDKAIKNAYIHGVFGGLDWANGTLAQIRHEKLLYCQPPKLKLTMDEEITILNEYVKRHPESADFPIGFVVELALEETFPCP
jgi:hypothetical protein